jgi:tetratricopeptide (TPR) repeat protein
MGILRQLFAFRETAPAGSPQAARESLNALMDAYRRGDYEAALRAAEGLRAAGQEASYCFFRGSMLMHLGRLQEAEPLLRRNVLMQSDPRRTALAYSLLGQSLQEQGRYDDAMDCFEAALRRCPGKGSVYRHMAELHLHRGDCPTEALKWATMAAASERATTAETTGMEEVNRLNLGLALSALAWAMAVARQDRTMVESLMAEALPLMGTTAKPYIAQAHYHAGRAWAALGEPVKSAEHYLQAAGLDPKGTWGRFAKAAPTSAVKSRSLNLTC